MADHELLVELGTEEIPASMLEETSQQLLRGLLEALQGERLHAVERARWYTPRRIIVALNDLPARQEDLVETVTGPPRSVAYDEAGAPSRAAIAFARKTGVAPSRLKTVQTPKGEYVAAVRRIRGESTRNILRRVLPSVIEQIRFPKTMYWTADRFRFVRPLRWVLALYRGKAIRFKIADVTSSNYTVGHRFLGKTRIRVHSLGELLGKLRENGVLADPVERQARIEAGLQEEAGKSGGFLLPDPELLRTVVNLNEFPSVIRGNFEEQYLRLPKEILVTVMREHQKYFSVVGPSGELRATFLAVINLGSDEGGDIRQGHERVLQARLADAAFFWTTDRRLPLADRLEQLKSVLFQERLGSYFDKTQRILALMPRLARLAALESVTEDLEAAARLSKCDLVTEMVKEFTDLQGIVGGLYAREEEYPPSVWRAVYEQYLPKATDAPSPETKAGALLALADRLDTVCGCFCVGLIPTGSRDPFAVRRQGNGILKILLDHRISASLSRLVEWSLESHRLSSPETAVELLGFFEGRLRFFLEDLGFDYDSINAVMSVTGDDPLDALERVKALQSMRREPDFLALATNFKRIVNILAQAGAVEGEPDAARLQDATERALWERYLDVRPRIAEAREGHNYDEALRTLASLHGAVNAFFDKVLVMAEDLDLRSNRLRLLGRLSGLFLSIADISKIVVDRDS